MSASMNNQHFRVEVQVQLSFHALRKHTGSTEVQLLLILNPGIRLRGVASFTPRHLHPRKESPGPHWTRGWVAGPHSL